MYTNKQSAAARFLAFTAILIIVFACLLTSTLAETADTYQISRFTPNERNDDSVRKYARSAEEAGFRLKRKQSVEEGRVWARLGRRQDGESSEGVEEMGDKEPHSTASNTATTVTSTSASALVTPGIENYLAAEDLTIPSIPEPSFGTYESFSASPETSGGTESSSATSSTISSETAGSSTSSSISATMPGGYATATDFPPISSDEAESSSATAPGGYVTATEFPPVTSDEPTSSSSSSATMPGGYVTATEFPPMTSDQPTSSSTSVSSSSQSLESASAPSPPPTTEPAPSPEPASEPAPTSNSEQPPPGPVETTLIPQGFSSIVPGTVFLTATASARATTVTRSSAGGGGDGVVMITGGTASKTTSAGPGGFVTMTSTATSNGAVITMTTTGTITGTKTTAGASKTHTIVINPSQGMNKLIPFILHAEVGETVEFLEYSSSSAAAPDLSPQEAEKEAKKLEVVQMELGQTCVPVPLAPESVPGSKTVTSTSTTKSSSVAGSSFIVSSPKPMLYGSADEKVCEGGMVLLVNPVSVTVRQKEGPQGQDKKVLVFADGVRVDGTGVKDVLGVWAGLTPDNKRALESFQSSSDMRPEAWVWGDEFGLGGLEELTLDVVVQNILYTRLTLALNPSLLELYSKSASGTNTNATSTSSGGLTAITEITAYDSLLSTVGGSTSTSEAYGGNAAGTGTSLPAGNHHLNGAQGRGIGIFTLGMSCLVSVCSCLVF